MRVGRAICCGLADAGHAVAVNYHTSAQAAKQLVRELEQKGQRAIAVAADVTDPDRVAELLDTTLEELGGLDLVVNNAAIFETRGFLELDDELWKRTLSVNLEGPFHVAHGAARIMWEAGGGRIINICGSAGIAPIGDYAAYCVSKAGLDTLTRCMAQALAPRVQVNGVAPGTVLFPEGTSADERERVIRRIPAGSTGSPEDVVAAVRFLSEAPDYVTGTIITVDGGASLAGADPRPSAK